MTELLYPPHKKVNIGIEPKINGDLLSKDPGLVPGIAGEGAALALGTEDVAAAPENAGGAVAKAGVAQMIVKKVGVAAILRTERKAAVAVDLRTESHAVDLETGKRTVDHEVVLRMGRRVNHAAGLDQGKLCV